MTDRIDVYDANLNHEGVMDRKEAHYAGRWHRTFHCWVVILDPEPSILFQVRSPRMRNFPNMLDVSAAGHIEAGEAVEDGVRELREELGIDIDIQKLRYLGERVEVADHENGQRNREYQSVYLLLDNRAISSYVPDPHEVWGLVRVTISDCLELFSGRVEEVPAEEIRYDSESQSYVEDHRQVGVIDFIPRIQRYYLAGAISAERALEGKADLAIS